MDLVINGNGVDFTLESERTMGELLGSIEGELERTGQTVVSVCVDGKDIPAESLDCLFARDITTVSKLELSTLSPAEILEMLKDSGQKLGLSSPKLEDIPVLLQTGKDLSVMETIQAFSLEIERLYRLIPLLPLTHLLPKTLIIDGVPLEEFPSSLRPLLEELLDALKRHDTVTVGDIAEYELAPRIKELARVIETQVS
jgi:hypothetical protein